VISVSSSRSWLVTSTAAPPAAKVEERLADHGCSARVNAPGRLVHYKDGRVAEDFTADVKFLQVAAGWLAASGSRLALRNVEAAVARSTTLNAAAVLIKPCCTMPLGGMAGQQGVFGKLQLRGAVHGPGVLRARRPLQACAAA